MKVVVVVALLVIVVDSFYEAQTILPDACPTASWSAFEGRCYLRLDTAKNWGDSEANCGGIQPGSSLASISALSEITHARSLGCNTRQCWLGAYQVQGQSATEFNWKDNVPYTFIPNSNPSSIWGSGSPNQATGNTDDCGYLDSGVSRMLDDPCTANYFGLCIFPAKCKAGFFRASNYRVVSGIRTDTGSCTGCPPGKYRTLTDPEIQCIDCSPGNFGSGNSTTDKCSGTCPKGSYCPSGTGTPVLCPAGTFSGVEGATSSSTCTTCAAGSFCPAGSIDQSLKCRAGFCGVNGATTDTCAQKCPPGFFCPTGSVCPTTLSEFRNTTAAFSCNSISKFCPEGSALATSVLPGFYSAGGINVNFQTESRECEPGNFCIGGEKIPCPAGKFNDKRASSSSNDCRNCTAGFFCAAESTSATADFCAPTSSPTPAIFYCPSGTPVRLQLQGGELTTKRTIPVTSNVRNRESVENCPSTDVCSNGIGTPKIAFNNGVCGSTFNVSENSLENTLIVDVNATVASGFNLAFSINSVTHVKQSTVPSCTPTNSTNNLNAFKIDSLTGVMRTNNGLLNFEACLPEIDTRYTVVVRATATKAGEATVTLDCPIIVEVLDLNEPPVYPPGGVNRAIRENQAKNTIATACDDEAISTKGKCPTKSTEVPGILASDPDDGASITYTLSPGVHNTFFKIHPCTAEISYINSGALRLKNFPGPPPQFVFNVTASDGKLNATRTVSMYIINVNDPPEFVSTSLSVAENLPSNSLVGQVITTDDDNDVISYSIASNDGNAFTINSTTGQIFTSTAGARDINFETAKKNYQLVIHANDGTVTSVGTVNIAVVNANDAPIFDDTRLIFFIQEGSSTNTEACLSASGICVGATDNVLKTTDEDGISDVSTFSLLTQTSLFTITPAGKIRATSTPINFEAFTSDPNQNLTGVVVDINGSTGRLVRLRVMATSTGNGIPGAVTVTTNATALVFIVDKNEAPVFNSVSAINIIESWPVDVELPQNVVNINVTDPDNQDTQIFLSPAPIQSVTFSIAQNTLNPLLDGFNFFSVVSTVNGKPVFNVKTSLINAAQASNSVCGTGKKCFQVNLTATDNGNPPLSTNTLMLFNVLDTNQAPVFPPRGDNYRFSVSEDPATVSVTTLSAIDSDSLNFTIIGGTGAGLFTINPIGNNDFQIRKSPVVIAEGSRIDFESQVKEWTVIIRASDNGKSSKIGQICKFDAQGINLLIDCGNTGGAKCDPTILKCVETCSPTNTSNAAQVELRPRINDFFCNYSSNEQVFLTIFPDVADVTVTIAITDANDPPLFVDSTGNVNPATCVIDGIVSTTTARPTVISAPQIVDQDTGIFGAAPFQFQEVNSGDPFWTINFSLNTNTGQVAPKLAPSSYTVGQVYSALVRVLDSNPGVAGNSTCLYRVTGSNTNAPPILTANTTLVTLPENSVQGIQLPIRFTVNDDPDNPIGFETSFTGLFTIDKTTGALFTGESPIDFESGSGSVSVLVKYTDQFGAFDTITITVNVLNVNEAPSFTNNVPTVITIDEDEALNAIVGIDMSTFATDPDNNQLGIGQISFSFTCSLGCPFVLGNASTGKLKVNSSLNFEASPNTWTGVYTVRDGGAPSLSSTHTVTIALRDKNEAPRFLQANPVISINETDAATTGNIALFDMSSIVTDDDIGDPVSSLSFSISGADASLFQVTNGILQLKQGQILDFETRSSYSFFATVSDDENLASLQKSIQVNLLNVNDVFISNIQTSNNGVFSCTSPQQITITGGNFGYKDHATVSNHATTVTVQYTFNPNNGVDSLRTYNATNCQVGSGNNIQITCQSVIGIGKDFVFRVSIRSADNTLIEASNFVTFATGIRYQEPSISALSNNALTFRTIGLESFTISGTCLGVISDNQLISQGRTSFVRYCSVSACYFPACSAITVSNGTALQCTSVPGIGKDFIWFAQIAGQIVPSTLAFGSYANPTVTSISYPSPLSTLGGNFGSTKFVITGTNFADTNEVPTSVRLRYSFSRTDTAALDSVEFSLTGCRVSSAPLSRTQITCDGVSPGIGKGLVVLVEFGGLTNTPNSASNAIADYGTAIAIDFTGPGAKDAETRGGQLVRIDGQGFGPSCGEISESTSRPCGYVSASYSKGSPKFSAPSEVLVYRPLCFVSSDSLLVCRTVEGTGSNHQWNITVGGNQVNVLPTATRTSYAAGSVGSYAGAGAVNANTNGGQSITIIGSNFGPLDGAEITAFYGADDAEDEFTGTNCLVTLAHQEVTCQTAQGVGAGLSWFLLIDGLRTRSELTNYGIPVITNVVSLGSNINNLSPDGGETIRIIGSNFGPPIANSPDGLTQYLEGVFFGPNGNPTAYEALNCVVLTHRLIECSTPVGIGFSHSWTVRVRGQDSAPSAVLTSYRSLVISSVSPLSGNSAGGYIVTVTASGAAVCDPSVIVSLDFSGEPRVIEPVSLSECITRNISRAMNFLVPQRTGGESSTLTLSMTTSKHNQQVFGQSASLVTFSYQGPVIRNIFAQPGLVAGTINVVIIGTSFCASESCCSTFYNDAIATSLVTSHSHTRISLIVTAPGALQVRCLGNQNSETRAFESSSPIITGTNPPLNSTQFNTRGGDTLEIWGAFFGQSLPTIRIGDDLFASFADMTHTSVECNDPASPSTSKEFTFPVLTPCYKTTIKIPPGTGKNLPLTVIINGGAQESLPSDPRFEFLSYLDPVITSIENAGPSNRFPTLGGATDIIIRGQNLFTNGTVVLGSVNSGILCVPTNLPADWDHELIRCRVREGEGSALQVIIVQKAAQSVPFGSAEDSIYYQSPSNIAVVSLPPQPFGYDTQGGDLLVLSGLNLGRSLSQTVTVDGAPCIVLLSNHTRITCRVPVGEGSGVSIQVSVAGQVAGNTPQFSYGAPVLLALLPRTGPTNALTPSGQPIALTLNGRNFGKDKISVFFAGNLKLLGERDSSKTSDEIDVPFISATHTRLIVTLPSFVGTDVPFRIVVKNQVFVSNSSQTSFSYEEPSVTGVISVVNNVTTSLPPAQTGSAPVSGGFSGGGSSGRRQLAEGSFGTWTTPNGLGSCSRDFRIPTTFWREGIVLQPDGSYIRTVQLFNELDCNPSSRIATATQTGAIADLGINSKFTCAQNYRDVATNVLVSPTTLGSNILPTICTCPQGTTFTNPGPGVNVDACLREIQATNSKTCLPLSLILHIDAHFGAYMISDLKEIYMTRTYPALAVVENSASLDIPDVPTAIVDVSPTLVGPVYNTDGCDEWEDFDLFNARRRSSNVNPNLVQRLCNTKQILTIEGSNFGRNDANITGFLRVFFVNPVTQEEFEASTTSSQGNHKQLCIDECEHDHTRIKVWVPFGAGTSLQVRVRLGGEQVALSDTTLNITVNYQPPKIQVLRPGSIFARSSFLDADGQNVVIEGENFGFTDSKIEALINGKPCLNPNWFQSSDGSSTVECTSAAQTVGPKSIIVCVSNQTVVTPLFSSDVAVLQGGEASGAWKDGLEAAQTDQTGFSSRVFSFAVTRCGKDHFGRMFEPCSPCPRGADCGLGSFREPEALPGFFKVEIDKFAKPERALERCGAGELLSEADLPNFPDLVPRDTCIDFNACEPLEACAGANTCGDGYNYALDQCTSIRTSITTNGPYVAPSGELITSNACTVRLDPQTGEFFGVDSDCRGTLPIDQQCDYRRPWECSVCQVVYETGANASSIPRGECTCIPARKCGLCTIGTHYRLNNACKVCPENVELLIGLFVGACIIAVGLAYILSKRKVNLAFIAIAIDYFQVLAVFSTTRIRWPPAILRLLELLSLFNLNIDIAAPECIVPNFEYEIKFYITQFIPAAAFVLLIVFHTVFSVFKILRDGRNVKLFSHVSSLISTFMVVMYFVYLSVTRRSLDIFNCNPTKPSDGFLYTEFVSFKCDGGGLCRCGEPGGVQQSLVPAAIAFLIAYSFGFPLFVFIVIYFNKSRVMEDQYLRAYGIGDSRLTNPDAYDLRKRFHILYMYYKPRTPYWLLVILCRKFFIAMSALLFRGNPSFQMCMILLVLFWAFVMQARWRPFLSTGERGVVIKELEARASMAIKNPLEYQHDYEMLKKVTTAVRLADEHERRGKENKNRQGNNRFWDNPAHRNKKSFMSKRTQYFFDFNSVELILLGCSIFICICGVMFESGRFEERKDLSGQQDAITYSLIVVVIGSFIYLLLVVLSETVPVASIFLARFMKHNNVEIQKELDQGVVISENPLLNAGTIKAANADELQTTLEQTIDALERAKKQNTLLRSDLKKLGGPTI